MLLLFRGYNHKTNSLGVLQHLESNLGYFEDTQFRVFYTVNRISLWPFVIMVRDKSRRNTPRVQVLSLNLLTLVRFSYLVMLKRQSSLISWWIITTFPSLRSLKVTVNRFDIQCPSHLLSNAKATLQLCCSPHLFLKGCWNI